MSIAELLYSNGFRAPRDDLGVIQILRSLPRGTTASLSAFVMKLYLSLASS